MDEVAQVAVIGLYVGLTRAHPQSLLPELAEVERNLSMLLETVRTLRILWYEYSNHADRAGVTHRSHQLIHGGVRMLMALDVVGLVPDTLAAFIGTFPARKV